MDPNSPNPPRRGRPPRTVALPRQFLSRVTEGEFAAIGVLAHQWSDKKQAEGMPLTGDNRTAWFRALIHREAKAAGIAIVEPTSQGLPDAAPVTLGVPLKPAPQPGRKKAPARS